MADLSDFYARPSLKLLQCGNDIVLSASQAGRSIVAFHGDSKNVAKVEALFGSNGLTKVKTF